MVANDVILVEKDVHKICNMLTAIIGYAELLGLNNEHMNFKERHYIKEVIDSANKLNIFLREKNTFTSLSIEKSESEK